MRIPDNMRMWMQTEKQMVILDQLVTSGGSFITTILLARALGIEEFGIYSSVILVMYLLLSISSALIINPFQVLQATHPRIREYISALFAGQLITCGLFAALSIPIFTFNISFISFIRPYLEISLLLMLTFLMQDFLRRVLLAIGQAKHALIIDTISNALQFIWLLASFGNLDLHYALLIISTTYIPSVVLGIVYLRPFIPGRSVLRETFFLQFKNGKWLLLTAILQWWAGNLFVVASGLFLGMKALGALRLAQTLFGVLNILLQVFENHVLPVASRLHKESVPKFKKYLWTTTRKGTLLMLPVSLALVVFAPQIFELSGGADYTEYAFALQGMAVLYFFIFAGYTSRLAIRVLLFNRDFFIGYVISFLFSLLAARFFIQQWGLTGVIAGLIINQLLLQAYWQFILIRKNIKLWKA